GRFRGTRPHRASRAPGGRHGEDPVSTEQEPIRLFLVDDQQLVRAGFRMVLDAQSDMIVVGEAGNGATALAAIAATAPDVVLMDIRMPRMDGVETTRRLTAAGALPKVLVLTT